MSQQTERVHSFPTPDDLGRFFVRLNAGSCWEWTAADNGAGYGMFYFNGGLVLAHRFAYEMFRGEIPSGMQLDHLCRNTRCVNPNHLEIVTPGENYRRGNGWSGRNARKTHCPQGHPYDVPNTLYDKIGRRICRECSRLRCKAYDAKRRANR